MVFDDGLYVVGLEYYGYYKEFICYGVYCIMDCLLEWVFRIGGFFIKTI